jgi:hypothetical protein
MSRSGSNFTGTGENLGIFNVHPHRKPDSEDVEKPVDVSVKVGGLSVDAYDDKSSDASVSLTLMYHWRDPRLAQWPEGAELPEDLWCPEVSMFGELSDADRAKIDGSKRGASVSFTPTGRETGDLTFMLRITALTVSCKGYTDIRSFPLDSHAILVGLSLGQTIAGSDKFARIDPTNGVSLLPSGYSKMDEPITELEQEDEWHITKLEWCYAQHTSGASGATYHDAMVRIARRRVPTYYLMKSFYPTATCGFLSLAAMIVPADELANRFSILLTLFLTVFAIQWITTERLPKTPFLTKLDRQIVLALAYIVLIAVSSMGLKAALRFGVEVETVERAELWMFVLGAVVYVLGFTKELMVIIRHQHSHTVTQKPGVQSAWSLVQKWEGYIYEAEVEPDGTVGSPQVVPGGISAFNTLRKTANPMAGGS